MFNYLNETFKDYNHKISSNVKLSPSPKEKKNSEEQRTELTSLFKELQVTDDGRNLKKFFGFKTSVFQYKHNLPFYWPTANIMNALGSNFALDDLVGQVPDFGPYAATRILTANNLELVYRTLLQMEDLSLLQPYLPLMLKDMSLGPICCAGGFVTITDPIKVNMLNVLTPHMDEMVFMPHNYSITNAIEILMLHSHNTDLLHPTNCYCYVTSIDSIVKDQVYGKFHTDPLASADKHLTEYKYDVIFRPSRMPLRYQYYALDLLSFKSPDLKNYLFPIVKPYKQPHLADLKTLNPDVAENPEQLQAVRNIVAGPSPNAPYIIFGPPGTGKTTTIVEAILQLRLHYPYSRILVTAGSNSTCDTIALRLIDYLDAPQYRHLFTSHQIIRIFAKTILNNLKNLDPTLIQASNCVQGIHEYPSVEIIQKYSIIVATLSTVGKLVMGDIGENNFFTHIFMDEAGASTEPESLVGIVGIKSEQCHVILTGDHKQLGPVLRSDRAAVLGLQQSLMERLLKHECYAIDKSGNYDQTLQTRLRRNYRSHSEIVRIYNHLYYSNELIAAARKEDPNIFATFSRLPNSKFPIVFQAVFGECSKDNFSHSFCNELEIEFVMWHLEQMLTNNNNKNNGSGDSNGCGIKEDDIGIVTPYMLQSTRIQQQLTLRGWHAVEVGSVEKFQGREKQIIIVSFVRSFSNLGFVSDPRRLNVIISRAKSLLILLGNPISLSQNPDFNFIINECTRFGTLLMNENAPPQQAAKNKYNYCDWRHGSKSPEDSFFSADYAAFVVQQNPKSLDNKINETIIRLGIACRMSPRNWRWSSRAAASATTTAPKTTLTATTTTKPLITPVDSIIKNEATTTRRYTREELLALNNHTLFL